MAGFFICFLFDIANMWCMIEQEKKMTAYDCSGEGDGQKRKQISNRSVRSSGFVG